MKKDSLLKGTVILAVAAFVARFLGLIQRIPLQRLLGDGGMASYGIAYNIYFMLLVIATAGVPSTLSKLISERLALGKYDEAQRIYRAALWFSLVAGSVMAVSLFVAAPYYARHVSRDPEAALAIQVLAPALFLFPLIAMMRGYFQGRQLMMAGGLSQIAEQILRVITAIVLAYAFLALGFDREWAVAGASFGGVMGGVAALGVMVFFWRKLKKQDDLQRETKGSEDYGDVLPFKKIYGMIFKLSIPISLISMTVPMVYLIDSSTVIALLQPFTGYEEAKEALGILTGRAQSLAGIPPILAIALSTSIVPVVSSAYAKRDMEEVSSQAGKALRLAVLSGLPAVVALCAVARSINGLLFADTEGTLIIAALTASSMFQILMMASGAILMGLGKMRGPMVFVGIGVAIKLLFAWALASVWGIYGVIAATALCFFVIMQLNLLTLRKTVRFTVLGRRWWGLLAAALLTGGTGLAADWVGQRLFQGWMPPLAFSIQALSTLSASLAVYVALLFAFGVVGIEELRSLPLPVRRLLSRLKPFKNVM